MIFQKRNIYLHYENLKKEKMPDFLKKERWYHKENLSGIRFPRHKVRRDFL